MPTIYQVEDITLSKSLEQLKELLTLANHVNIFTRLRFMRDFPRGCAKCLAAKEPP